MIVVAAVAPTPSPVVWQRAASGGTSWSALAVALFALGFTIGSFYWLHWRRGRLRAWAPQAFAASTAPDLNFRFPMALHNEGAKPIVVLDLRMVFLDESGQAVVSLAWSATADVLYGDVGRVFPSAFAVPGRTAVTKFVEFQRRGSGFAVEPRSQRVRIEVRLGHRPGWRPLVEFALLAKRITDPARLLPYSNAPDWVR